jgi:hypothetical protein
MDLIRSSLSTSWNDTSLYTTANVNFSDTIDARSGGMSDVLVTKETTDGQDFPTILLAMLSKQNILTSVVPSVAMNVNLYLKMIIRTIK